MSQAISQANLNDLVTQHMRRDFTQLLSETDPRRAKLLEENKVLTSLLPQYWTAGQIRERLQADGVNDQGAKNDGQAIGMAMGHLKKINAPVEGQTVKEAVAEMRKG